MQPTTLCKAGYASPIIEMDIEEAKQTYDTNVWGTIPTTQAFAGLLIKSSGRIVNVSTVGSVLNMPWICASSPPYKPTFLFIFLASN